MLVIITKIHDKHFYKKMNMLVIQNTVLDWEIYDVNIPGHVSASSLCLLLVRFVSAVCLLSEADGAERVIISV